MIWILMMKPIFELNNRISLAGHPILGALILWDKGGQTIHAKQTADI